MSSTSSDLTLSLPEYNSSCCNQSKQNDETPSKKNTSENYKVKSQSLSEDRSEHYARLLKESEQALANRNVLISLLQEQLVKMEELYKKTHEKHTHYNTGNHHPLIHNKSAEAMRRHEDELKIEDKSLVKLFENWGAQQKLETTSEKSNKPEGPKTSSGDELTTSMADSNDLSIVDSMRSLNILHIKSVRSKIETEFFQECQVNFEGSENSKEITELLHAQEEIDSFHRLARTLEESPPEDRSQKDTIEDLQRGLSNFSSIEEQSLYESPRRKRTMPQSELRMLSEQLFQKEYVINAQQKKMRRLENKLERTYQELMKQMIKNKKECEGRLDTVDARYRNPQKEEGETQQNEETTGGLQDKLSCMLVEMAENEKTTNRVRNKLSCMMVETKKAKLQSGLQNMPSCNPVEKKKAMNLGLNEKLSSFLGKIKDGESVQSLTIEEVKSQVTMAIKREQDVDVLQTKIIQMASELVNANKEITKCVEQNRTLLEDYEVKLEHVQDQYSWAKEENENLDARLKQLQQELEASKSQEAELRENLNEAQHVKETIESQLIEKDKRIGILDQNFKQMTEELDSTQKERAQFIQEVQKLFGEYDTKLAIVKDECENAQNKILQLRKNKSALNLELTTAQAETEQIKRDYETLKQTMEEEQLRNKEKELTKRGEVKSLQEQLETSNKNRVNLMNEMKKLKGEMQTRECNAQSKIAMLLKQLEDSDREREAYVEENKKLFCRYESEMRQLNDDCEKMREEIRCLKTEKPSGDDDLSLNELLGELRARTVRLEEDKGYLQNQIKKLVFNYEDQLENQCEEYERKMMLINGSQSNQEEEEINKLRARIFEMEVALERNDFMNQNGNSEASLCGRSSNNSIPVIKEESVLEAYEELVTEKEALEGKLKELVDALEDERKSKTQLENELFRFRENERAANENLRRILPEFLGQGDKPETRTNPSSGTFDLLLKELERAKAEKLELIKKGKQIFYHYEANIIKLKSDYERIGGEERLGTHYTSIKELKDSQEAYAKKLTCCLQELAVYKDDVKNWMEAYDKVVREKSDLETETKILVNNVLHQDEAIKEMQEKLCNAEEKLACTCRENEEKEKVISEYHAKYNLLSREYKDAQNQLGQLKQIKDEMNQEITAKNKVIRQYEEQVDSERIDKARLNEDIAFLKTKLSTLEEEIEEKEKEFYVQLDETKSALFDMTKNYEKLETDYGYLSEQQEDIRFYKTQNAKLINEIEERGEKIKSLKVEIEELEKELCNVRAEVDLNNASASQNWEQLQSACSDLEKKLELTKYALKKQECQAMIKADDDFKDLQRQIETLKEKLACKDEEISRLSEKLERAQKERTELKSHMASTMRELEGEIEEIKSNNRMLREQINERSQQLLQQKQNETSKENECEDLKQQLKEACTQRTSQEAALQAVKSKNEKLQADLSRMEKELLVNESWKTENVQLQEKLDDIESELFGVKHHCSEVHEQLKTTKIKLAETQEELSCTKRDLENARSSITACGVETRNESNFFSSKTETTCMKVNLEKRSDTIKPNKHITVLYNNTKFSESRCETESTLSNVMLARGTKIQERLASLNQMEKEVEEMITAVQQQNKKLKDCHMARVKNEKDINTRLQKVRQRRDTLATDFNTFQAEIGHQAISVRKQFDNT